MRAVRHLLAQRHLAVLLCTATLLLRLLVPTGYMIASDHGRMTLIVCPGVVPQGAAMAMAGMDHGMEMASDARPGPKPDHGKTEMPCAFAGLSAQMLGAVDIVLLAVALAVVAVGALFTVTGVAPRSSPYLRPPLRGPPLTA